MLSILIFSTLLFAESPIPNKGPESLWQEWKKATFENALNSPTSFLNAYALEKALSGKSLYLVASSQKKQSQWVKEKPKDYYANAEHLGEKIRLQIQGSTDSYLNNKPQKQRRSFKLPSGDLAEVVYGRRNKKMWTYLYDPEQIKSFTGFRFYPFNDKAVVTGVFKAQKPRFVSYKTVQGDPTKVNQVGNISFVLDGKEFFLPAYNWQKPDENLKYVAMVYTDETQGSETYSGGRELVVDIQGPLKDGQKLSLDFNRTINFFCAHSPFWHCPVGLQKHIKTKVKAGEMLPLKKIVN